MNRNIGLMYIVGFVSSLHFFGGVLIPFFTQWGNLPLAVIPQIQLWFMWWSALFEMPTGIIADKYGGKVSVVLGLFVCAIGITVYVAKPHIGFFLLGEFVVALGFALVSGADVSVLLGSVVSTGDLNTDKILKTKVRSRYQICRRIGTIVGGMGGSVLAVRYGYQAVYVLSGLTFLTAAVVAATVRNVSDSNYANQRTLREIWESAYRLVRYDTAIKKIALNSAVVAALTGTIIWFNQMVLEEIEFPLIWFGAVGSLGMIAEIVYSWLLPDLRAAWGVAKLVRISAMLPVVGFCVIIVAIAAQSWLLAVVGIAISFTIIDGWISLMDVLIDEKTPESEFNTVRSTILSLRKLCVGACYIVMSITLLHSVILAVGVIGGLLFVFNVMFWRRGLRRG